MKRISLNWATFLMSVAFVTISLLFPSCKKGDKINEDLAIAPKNMTGKTLKVDGVKINFSSNTSATIVDYIGTAKRSSVSYNRTSEVEADLSFSYLSEDSYTTSERSYRLTLSFADKTEGVANGSYDYSLTIAKGSKYQTHTSGTSSVKNGIFTITE